MSIVFQRSKGTLTRTETPYSVRIAEVWRNGELVAYAQEVQSPVLQPVLLSVHDATLLKDDPDWKGPRA